MNKNIVLCSDGTGNSANKGRGTNVFKLYEAVDTKDGRQFAFYDDGVGTERWKPVKLFGGAFGYGLARNVRQLYTSLCRAYSPGDEIFLFGFSRGAFTVRTLAGFILKFGVIKVENLNDEEIRRLVRKAYGLYRAFAGLPPGSKRSPKDQRKYERAEQRVKEFCQDHCHPNWATIQVRFIGVWDTVDAVGTPWDELTDALNAVAHFKFSDQTLSSRVMTGRHAIAIDDERRAFKPVMWDESEERDDRIKQVWFAGVHSNVGGGYPKQGMSLVTLDWMMEEASQAGLEFVASSRNTYRDTHNVNDKCYNSRTGLATYYFYQPRDINDISSEAGINTPLLHDSVFRRIAVGTEGYAPGGIPGEFRTEFTRTPQPDLDQLSTDVITAAYENEGDGSHTLIARNKNLVTRRQNVQRVFMFVTAMGIAAALWTSDHEEEESAIVDSAVGFVLPEWAADLLPRVLSSPFLLVPVVAVGFLAWLWGRSMRMKQDSVYSKFWSRIAWPDSLK